MKANPLKITVGDNEIDVYFNYSQHQSKTACPNSNSSFNAIDNTDLNQLKANAHFNHKISEWKKYIKNETDPDADEYIKKYKLFKKYILGNENYDGTDNKTISKKNSVLNKDRFAYFGDTILIGSTMKENVKNTQFFGTQTAFEGKSDHLFVESHDSAPPTNVGGAKGKKRKTEKYSKEEKKNRSNKMKRRNRRYSR